MSSNDLPVTYLAGTGSGLTWGQAFAFGCKGRAIISNILRLKPFAGFVVPELYSLFNAVVQQKLDFYYGDHAYFGRKVYFRTTKNALQHDCQGESNGSRFAELKVKIKAWRTGSKILLCPQSEIFHAFRNCPRPEWIENTKKELRKYTDRPIEIRYKAPGLEAEKQFRDSLKDVHAVVVFTSVAGVQAALEGVPCFATHDCASAKFGSKKLSEIENPTRPDNRLEMAQVLADNQWTLEEMKKGITWQSLQ
jgi:hypothetical protein